MKQFCYKKWVKICAAILCILSFNVAIGSFIGILLAESKNFYNYSQEEFRERAYESICNKYSVLAMSGYQDNFDMEELQHTNFRYAVLQTEDLERFFAGDGLNDPDSYLVCNFDKPVTEDMLSIHSYSIGESTDFLIGDSLWEPFSVYHGMEFQTMQYMVEACYYARDTKTFYCQADGKFYPAAPELDMELNDTLVAMEEQDKNGILSYRWEDGTQQVHFNGQTWYLSDIPIVLNKELSAMGKVIVSTDADAINYEDYQIYNGYVEVVVDELANTKDYYVLSYVREPLKTNGAFFEKNIFEKLDVWERQDFFVQAEAMIRMVFAIRYDMFACLAVASLLCIVSLIVLCTGAGHCGSQEIVPRWLDRIPFDVFSLLLFCLGVLLQAFVVQITCKDRSLFFLVFYGGICMVLAEMLCLRFSVSVAVRIKMGKWWKNTLCFRGWNRCAKIVKSSIEKMRHAFPLLWRAWAMMAALALLEFCGLMATSYVPEVQLLLWFLEKIVLYGFLTVCLLQMKKLQQAGQRLAAGELNSGLNTERMLWDFKRHGDHLNNIREGIHRAVAEQMKSERFKTELITNVSHDIKTPLTSMINYVDLLEKEEIDNPNVREYLDVLSRQSARLKKLIEDLMEASKASTGNLTVLYERCDAQVMLTQTIGEFEEKLKAGQIELIVQGSEKPLVIQADPRHLWRIFDNLMNNICKYAQPSTRAYVNIETPGNRGQIVFRNISKYALNIDSQELMERFVRGDSSRNTEGSGLGISIAKSLTELMQGSFELIVDGDLFKVIISFPVME